MSLLNVMDRRQFVRRLSVLGAVSLAGCSGLGSDDSDRWTPSSTSTSEPEAAQETFEYILNDKTGSIGQAANQNVPEDAPEWKVVDNTLEETDWQEMENNDLQEVEDRFKQGVSPNGEGYDTTVDEIATRTQEIMNNAEEELGQRAVNPVENVAQEDEAVIYTRALTAAAQELAGIESSGAAGAIIPVMAEPVLEQIEVELQNFSLSTMIASEAIDQGFEEGDMAVGGIPKNVSTGNSAEKMKINSGLKHPIGLLQYTDQDGNQQLKYSEVTGNNQSLFPDIVRDPAESNYAMPLGSEPEEYQNQLNHPEHFVSALEYSKAREIQNMGGLTMPTDLDQGIFGLLYQLVDDGLNDRGDSWGDTEFYGETPGVDVIVEDSFGESLEEFKQNPTQEKANYLENTARGMKLAIEKNGYDEPFRLSGSIEDPTYEHLARDEFEQIIDKRQQRISS